MTGILICLAAYLVGSVNMSILIPGFAKKDDPRNQFSGNAGTTNVYRMLGLKWAVMVLLADVGKAFLLALVAKGCLPSAGIPWIGFALLAGNRFPCFHGFRGGKGVAHFIGFALALVPMITCFSLALWCLVYRLVRLPFAASLALVGTIGAGLGFELGPTIPGNAGILLCLGLIVCNHRQNILNWKS